jgi:hypothetical protein
MNRLPYDVSRCEGAQCVVRNACLRYISLSDIGQCTPVTENMCDYETPGATNYFLPHEDQSTMNQGAKND